MKTVFIGLCEINRRQHFCGLWPDLAHVEQQLAGAYSLTKLEGVPKYGTICNAVAAYDAEDTGADRASLPASFPGFIGSDSDGFTVYEVDMGDLPGFLPFDED